MLYEDLDFAGAYQKMAEVEEPSLAPMLALMGYMNYIGQGTRENNPEAYRLYSLAADQNDPFGLYGKGMCVKFGYGVRKNNAQGEELIRQGLEIAVETVEEVEDRYTRGRLYNMIGRCYYHGLVYEKDESKAKMYFERGAKVENPDALAYLGVITYGDKALAYSVAAADHGSAVGAVNAGRRYLARGETVENYELAVKYLQYAVDWGNADAKKDLNKAKKLLEKALKEQEAAQQAAAEQTPAPAP
jgi:hypothetical protein